MRRLSCLCLFIILFLAVMSSGCVQPSKTSAVETAIQTPVTTPPVVATTDMPKSLTFVVSKTEKTVNVTYTGGPDAADLLALKIRIDNQDTSVIERTVPEPAPGNPILFYYMGLADPVVVNIIGTFKGGYQQTVLMYYF